MSGEYGVVLKGLTFQYILVQCLHLPRQPGRCRRQDLAPEIPRVNVLGIRLEGDETRTGYRLTAIVGAAGFYTPYSILSYAYKSGVVGVVC
ncbi:hypothetical protein E2C01_044349 [Portunus trituberculatus]|uniref:Uncharacterized protein n=1 Tax=Portunus trituberculatus TaxID=210409 RepID=A0A5B7FRW1_PORTR|nr:hypothetical protein [Portunus trituberculatus]